MDALDRGGHAYRSLIQDRDHHVRTVGTVLSYAVKYKSYQVRVHRRGQQRCQAIVYGVDKPYKRGDTVVVAQYPGVDWVIEGLVPGLSPFTGDQANAFSERALDLRVDVENALVPDETAGVSYRPFDGAGNPEPAQYPGEVLLENRTESYLDRAWIKIYRFGVIMLQASPGASLRIDQATRTIRVWASRLLRKTAAYSERVETQLDGDLVGTAVHEETMRAHVSGPPVVSSLHGYVPELKGTTMQDTHVLQQGVRLDIGGMAVELDATTGTVRVNVGGAVLRIGSFAAENEPHPESGVTSPDGTVAGSAGPAAAGIDLSFGDARVLLSADEVRVLRGALEVQLAADLTVKNGSQKMVLGPHGLTIDVDQMTVNANSVDFNTPGG